MRQGTHRGDPPGRRVQTLQKPGLLPPASVLQEWPFYVEETETHKLWHLYDWKMPDKLSKADLNVIA